MVLICIPITLGFACASSEFGTGENIVVPESNQLETLATNFLDEYLWEVYMYIEGDYAPYMTMGYGEGRADTSAFSAEELAAFQEAEANMHYIENKAAYWRIGRLAYGTMRNDFSVFNVIRENLIQDNQATVEISAIVSFFYEGEEEKSLAQSTFEISMAQISDTWLITDVLQLNDWFDATYKNDSDKRKSATDNYFT